MSVDQPLAPRRYERSEGEQRSRQQETRQLEARIAAILRTGVVTAAVLLTVALPWMVFQDRSHRAHRLSVGEGLRLLLSAFLFWRKRDRLYLALSLTVCVIIAVGALLTGGGH
jgi:uncharacterized membrane protein